MNLYDGDERSSFDPIELSTSSSEFPFNNGALSELEGGDIFEVDEDPMSVPNLLSCTNFESIWFSIPRA